MPSDLAELCRTLSIANRILAHEGVLDAFGHVSVRHPDNAGRYLLSRSRGPELVEPADIVEFDLDSQPVKPQTVRLYGERVIHGEIYKARPDVMAVCHHHAPAIMPFAISGAPLVPVFHMGGPIGPNVPMWDQRDDFGDTNLLVVKPEEGASLARALGPDWLVLMRRHGATVAGRGLHELVFRCVYSCQNAQYLTQAMQHGNVSALNAAEIKGAGAYNLQPGPVMRAWEYWTVRLAKKGEMPPAITPKRVVKVRPAAAAARSGSKKTTTKGRKKR